ncbi:MAG: carboxypeptidase regulatory-like domain-containing protein [Acidobacteriaceae bacterium]
MRIVTVIGNATFVLALALPVAAPLALFEPPLSAQTVISGDIVGSISDSTGAAIPGAQVTAKAASTGDVKNVIADNAGNFRISLLKPDTYNVTVTASGFSTASTNIPVSAGQVASASLKLAVGSNTQEVIVTESAPLLHTEDASISTTFDLQAVQNLPNPGNDLTFIAQTAPGSIMNTQGGYGNFSSFGLPATSNTFTLNGSYENYAYLNLNNSGPTNLLLGNNDISSVTVLSPAYDSAYGGLGGAQTNEISRAGGNQFHGNATYWWNGRVMNANSWFNKHAAAGLQAPRAFDNANQWAAAIGGPLKKDKTFFFVNTEGLRVIIPVRATVYAPSPAFQASTLATVGANFPSEVPLYQRIFNLYNTAPGAGTAIPEQSGDPDVVQYNSNAANFAHEWLITGRIDQILSDKDRLFGHVKIDKGVQPTFTSFLSPLFNVASPQPAYDGQLNETHSFSPNLTNQFIFSASYNRAIFSNPNQVAANALVPYSFVFLDGALANNTNNAFGTSPGGLGYDFPQGTNDTGYQFIDDLNWTRGNHTIKVGISMRRNDITDYTPSVRALTPEVYTTTANFASGYLSRFRQSFPTSNTQPIALYALGVYVEDQWKARPNLTVTYGMRFEHNSNPVCQKNCFANLSDNFLTLAAATTTATPYNQLISSGLHQAFPSFQTLAYEPRIGIAYLPFGPGSKTTIRAGFGMFADTLPGLVAGNLLTNAPSNVQFYLRGKFAIDPTLPNSGAAAAAASNAAFVSSYSSGASFDTLSAAGIGFTAPAFNSTAHHLSYPMYESYNLAVEQQLDRKTVVAVSYVGNHGYHEPVVNDGINGYGFGSLPAAAPTDSFAAVSDLSNGAGSNYNGGVVTLTRREKLINLQFNYLYSHAFDEVSNGGVSPFTPTNASNPENPYNLSQNYGPADYDVRHYISANYVISVPQIGRFGALTGNWTIGGTVFHSTGLPFTVIDSNTPANYGGAAVLYAQQLGKGFSHSCQGAAAVDNPCAIGTPDLTVPPALQPAYVNFVPATDFGQQRRNQFRGSGYTDTDLDLTKGIKVPHWESANLKLGAQFFNLFNHPNFGQPLNDVGSSGLGTINTTVSTPTSILGSFLGGDASPRLIQLKADFTF